MLDSRVKKLSNVEIQQACCWAVILETHAPSAGQDEERIKMEHRLMCCRSHINKICG